MNLLLKKETNSFCLIPDIEFQNVLQVIIIIIIFFITSNDYPNCVMGVHIYVG